MSLTETSEAVTFDGAGVAVTFALCGYVDFFADCKGVCFDDVAYVNGRAVVKSELAEIFLRGDIRFCEMSFECFGEMFFGDLAISELNGFITVVFKSFLLNNDAGAGLNDRYRNYFSCFVKKLDRKAHV